MVPGVPARDLPPTPMSRFVATLSQPQEPLETGPSGPAHLAVNGADPEGGGDAGSGVAHVPCAAGATLGGCRLERELGRGATGVVYLARELETGRKVAVKTLALAAERATSELNETRERFLREAQAAGRLKHPDIIATRGSGAQDGLAYLVMEFAPGRDLAFHATRDHLLPLHRLLAIGARVARALAHAHRQGVMHGDIKPANILWEPESETLKVTDFNMARIAGTGDTRTGRMLGTPAYMAPEQFSGGTLEGRSDLYSLGVTLYQLVCGTLPFAGESLVQLMHRVAHEPPVNLLRLRPGLPPCVVQVIYRAMLKNPEQRYRDGDEMALALRACAGAAGGAAA